MPFCPKCRYEYVEGVEVCPDCGVALVDELPEEEPPRGKLVPIRRFKSRLYAEMVKDVLDREGIPCFISGDDVGILGMSGFTGTDSVWPATLWGPEDKKDYIESLSTQMLDHI